MLERRGGSGVGYLLAPCPRDVHVGLIQVDLLPSFVMPRLTSWRVEEGIPGLNNRTGEGWRVWQNLIGGLYQHGLNIHAPIANVYLWKEVLPSACLSALRSTEDQTNLGAISVVGGWISGKHHGEATWRLQNKSDEGHVTYGGG